jgi:hypothetical protein
MQKAGIKVGEEYVLRDPRKPDAPVQRVRILQHVRGKKWKAEWIEPNPGLADYVEAKDILIRWKDRKPFLRDEQSERQLRAEVQRQGYVEDSPVANALHEVFESIGEKDISFYRGMLEGSPEALDRLKERAKVDREKTWPLAYVDRHGTVHLPLDAAIGLAKAFCAAEPMPVLTSIESTEREWSMEAGRPGGEHLVSLLNEYRASWALIRQWTGHDPAIAQREAQIQRLERLVWDAIYALQKAGLDKEAHRLRQAVPRG